MCAMQRNQTNNQQQNQQQPQPPEPQYRFRWGILIGIPLVILIYLWFTKGIEPNFEFEDIMRNFGVIYEEKYIRLASLAVVLVTVTLVIQSFKNHSE